LRKWILPQLATPLLIIRDPVVLVLYFFAIKAGVFPKNGFITALLALVFLSLPLGLIQITAGLTSLPVLAYGLRTNFLHFPFIFLLPQIMNRDDVRQIGKWLLIGAVPMAALMVLQFQSPADAPINKAIGDGQQLDAAMGKIRPPAVFSFITGPVSYFALVTAFLAWGLSEKKAYSPLLLVGGAFSLVAAIAVSGSRSALLAALVVFAAFQFGLILSGRFASGLAKVAVAFVLMVALVSQTEFFAEGIEVFAARWQLASEFEEEGGGIIGRMLYGWVSPIEALPSVPFLGAGIGRGTTVGAQLLTGFAYQFLLAENEWSRVLFEAGPLAGMLTILFRVVLTGWMGVTAAGAARAGNVLPLALFGACGLDVLSGQLGPATSLGFVAVGGGLCLAAMRVEEPAPAPAVLSQPAPRRPRRRPRRALPAERSEVPSPLPPA
jgi:hypothetical protein